MTKRKAARWSRLDNAAKIFPSTSRKTDTSVFRFYCELMEQVEPGALETALENAIKEFPNFLSVLRKGAFWYYLESTEKLPRIVPESESVCKRIYEGDNSALLFEISYYKNRINLEIYHVLADGTGALQFLKTIVYHYLKILHGAALPPDMVFLENDATYTEKNSDSFTKYYKKQKGFKLGGPKKAYNIPYHRDPEENLQVIEAIVSVKALLAAAHSHHTTLTVFLTAVFVEAIHKEMSLQGEKLPIVLMVPVNLRQFFPSETTRNFFGLIDIQYNYSTAPGTFEDLLTAINAGFKEKLTTKFLSAKMNKFAAMEHNFFAKIAPLPIKNIGMKIAGVLDKKKQTAVISNVGRVTMPPELTPYIDFFGVLSGTLRLQLCMCSFGDKLQIGFTSAFPDTDIQKNFIRALTALGIEAEIRSNDFFKEEEPPCSVVQNAK